MTAKEYEDLNDEILIAETDSEELSDQELDSVAGGLNFIATVNKSSPG